MARCESTSTDDTRSARVVHSCELQEGHEGQHRCGAPSAYGFAGGCGRHWDEDRSYGHPAPPRPQIDHR